jgi:hypothetical protein
LTLNYEWRTADLPTPLAITNATQRNNALLFADNLGNRVSAQVTWSF